MRLFVGIPLPKRIRGKISEILSDWREIRGIKYVEEENLHITIKFIGEVDENRVKNIEEALQIVKTAPFQIHLHGIGAFPSKERPRVIWIGIKEGFGELVALGKEVDEVLAMEGVPREVKEFHPHVTIGRVKRWDLRIAEKMEKYKDVEVGAFDFKRFTLFKSTLTPKGPIYEKIRSYEVGR